MKFSKTFELRCVMCVWLILQLEIMPMTDFRFNQAKK